MAVLRTTHEDWHSLMRSVRLQVTRSQEMQDHWPNVKAEVAQYFGQGPRKTQLPLARTVENLDLGRAGDWSKC